MTENVEEELTEDEQREQEERFRERNRGIIDRHVNLLEEDFLTYVAQTSDHSLKFPISKSDSVYLWDAYGNSFLDFTAGIGVNNVGNANFFVAEKIREQLSFYTHSMVYGEHVQGPQVEYAKLLSAKFPPKDDHPQQVFFVNSGNEAVDLALKITRKVTNRKPMLALKNGFHGRGYGAMSVSWKDEYKQGFFVDDSTTFLTPGDLWDGREDLYEQYAGVILELVQGEAGCIPLEVNWVQKLVKRVRDAGGVVIIDEIQTGYGRTGTFLAQEQYQVEADITCLGKAGGGGLPFGAVVSSKTNFEKLQTPNLSHLTTFGGNPVVMAAGVAVVELIHDGLLEHVKEVGVLLHDKVAELAEQFPQYIKGSQGAGLMQGLILNTEEQGQDFVEVFFKRCLTRGLLMHFKLNNSSILRMSPPLIVSDRSIMEAISIMADACISLEEGQE